MLQVGFRLYIMRSKPWSKKRTCSLCFFVLLCASLCFFVPYLGLAPSCFFCPWSLVLLAPTCPCPYLPCPYLPCPYLPCPYLPCPYGWSWSAGPRPLVMPYGLLRIKKHKEGPLAKHKAGPLATHPYALQTKGFMPYDWSKGPLAKHKEA